MKNADGFFRLNFSLCALSHTCNFHWRISRFSSSSYWHTHATPRATGALQFVLCCQAVISANGSIRTNIMFRESSQRFCVVRWQGAYDIAYTQTEAIKLSYQCRIRSEIGALVGKLLLRAHQFEAFDVEWLYVRMEDAIEHMRPINLSDLRSYASEDEARGHAHLLGGL
jgi:hypothetical protein